MAIDPLGLDSFSNRKTCLSLPVPARKPVFNFLFPPHPESRAWTPGRDTVCQYTKDHFNSICCLTPDWLVTDTM